MAHALWLIASLLSTAVAVSSQPAPSCDGGEVCPERDLGDDAIGDTAALLQHGGMRLSLASGSMEMASHGTSEMEQKTAGCKNQRIEIAEGGKFVRGGDEVVLLGANYVVKAKPYFPPVHVVRDNAARIAADVAESAYEPKGEPKKVKVPCVRLGALFEGMMPRKAWQIDARWLARLEETIKAFAKHNVYVLIDAHVDAWSTTNGGEGFPAWMGQYMQETAENGESYIASPEHPLDNGAVAAVLGSFGFPVPPIITRAGDQSPWRNYSIGSRTGDPRLMNIGNLNMRLNNNDGAWQKYALVTTYQVQNSYYRFLTSHARAEDKKRLFDPYVEFVRQLFGVWKRHSNVVAVELLNEPPFNGLPDMPKAQESRTNLWTFYATVMDALEQSGCDMAPVALEDVGGSVRGASQLDTLSKEPDAATAKRIASQLERWASRGKLVLSFHWYPGLATQVPLDAMIDLALKEAARIGGAAVWLSEFFDYSSQGLAEMTTFAADRGCGAVTYWHYVCSTWTGQPGWYKYPPSVLKYGLPIDGFGNVNEQAWAEYIKTVEDGSYWGAYITGAGGGNDDVLRLMK
mmetsp:Transcript_129630/g.375435  ORF Transcript_129630/g.375435 Transcript_129630/m.375435 type:complete len:574 (+) Transcript_129630:74-1795(+)|eukprot:CAMPEP_0176063666 /NCGR_PEP_ID=MMETSP0120_2-20121206/31754_1 /TAXON_ID=160619 /ORGANISM="Kryptoperidinium foliaceum, Strain CCMP 1326" /LENGTH=573 /DNA_ID=CAMNT_0017397241 /DNA_START=65 /DNA_END=1786 /DNA_ORIENTATION=-